MISRPRADPMGKAKVTPSAAKAASKTFNSNHPSKRPAKRDASAARNGHQNGHASHNASNGDVVHPAPASTGKWAGLPDKIKELVRLAQEQGYLTYTDINDALPDSVVSPEDLDEIYIKLRSMEVEIVDQAEVDRVKQPEVEEEEDKTRLDI